MVDLSNNDRPQKAVISSAETRYRCALTDVENTFDVQLINSLNLDPIPDTAAPFAREYLGQKYPEMIAAYNDLFSQLVSKGCILSEKFFKRLDGGAPLIVLEVRDALSRDFLIPNINLLLESPYDNLRDRGHTSQKQIAALPGETEGRDEIRMSKYAFESYSSNAPLRLVFFAASESGIELPEYRSTVPLVMRVQMSAAAEEQALRLAESRLSGRELDYSYVYDELLIPSLREQIYEFSHGFAGIRQEPEVLHEDSRCKEHLFSISALVSDAESTQEQIFEFAIVRSISPFLQAVALEL